MTWTVTPPKTEGRYWYMESKSVYAPYVVYVSGRQTPYLGGVWWSEPIIPPPHRPEDTKA